MDMQRPWRSLFVSSLFEQFASFADEKCARISSETKEQLVEDNKKKLAAAQEEYQEQLLKIEKEGKDERIQIKAEYLAREEDFQASEKSLKLKIAQLETANVALQTKYDRLKKHAEEKLDG
jgi:hypothetical protein